MKKIAVTVGDEFKMSKIKYNSIKWGVIFIPIWLIMGLIMVFWIGDSGTSESELFFRFVLEKIIFGPLNYVLSQIDCEEMGCGIASIPLLFGYLALQGFIVGFIARHIYLKIKKK